ncbi:uncharacterized protein RCC_03600 [Ramularia collo-cygni]|uniref:Uncharacterized protein n=1 Tax=Ramularia collo-cygni TaxID=112498 RepID=A0A2D3VBB9_9PEZI|nr:uncharacterized protein RCC_03600 [Ramularia collo-cygni]CZT17763.1 uncharacterized protein RCC_03600 [Ramularia collo-cygni]
MCNGESTRTSQGGTIAILKPITPISSSNDELRPCLQRELSLRLSPSSSSGATTTTTTTTATTTKATITGLSNFHSTTSKATESYFIIHRTGDLRHDSQNHHLEDSCILHTFKVPGNTIDQVSFCLGKELDLGVGGDEGVIGRRVSFLQGGRVLGEGVMGWN